MSKNYQEKHLQKDIIKKLNKSGYICYPTTGNIYEIVRADITGVRKGDGKRIEIEVKHPAKKSINVKDARVQKQIRFLEVMRKAGALTSLTNNIDVIFKSVVCPECNKKSNGSICWYCGKVKI